MWAGGYIGEEGALQWVNGVSDFAEKISEIVKRYRISYYEPVQGESAASGFQDRVAGSGQVTFSSRKHSFLSLYPGTTIAPLFPKPYQGRISPVDFKTLEIKSAETGECVLFCTHPKPRISQCGWD